MVPFSLCFVLLISSCYFAFVVFGWNAQDPQTVGVVGGMGPSPKALFGFAVRCSREGIDVPRVKTARQDGRFHAFSFGIVHVVHPTLYTNVLDLWRGRQQDKGR